MNAHVSDDLPRLLTGDATRDEVLGAAAHMRSCPDCQQELVSAVVAHASLTSARRFARQIVASTAAPADDVRPATELPDLSAMFAQVRDEARAPQRPNRRRWIVAGAAAVLIATAAGVTIAETVGSGSSPSRGRTVALAPYDIGTQSAKATLLPDGTMRLDASALPRLDAGHFYEVWLTDAARQRLQAIGSIADDNRAQLTISPKVMARYSAIEVSVQRLNQTAYSGTSVLRGSYG
jgi:hypothetical protein